MSNYGFTRTADGKYQPIVDDVPYGDPVPTTFDAVTVLEEAQERYSNEE